MGFFPDPTQPDPYHYDIFVTAHEMGHNAGTGHTHDNGIDTCDDPNTIPQRGSIMSYCQQTWSGMNANQDLYFHSRIQRNIDAGEVAPAREKDALGRYPKRAPSEHRGRATDARLSAGAKRGG